MAKFAPQYNPHKITSILKSITNGIFWFVFLISALPLLISSIDEYEDLKVVINVATIVSIPPLPRICLSRKI